MEFIFFLFCGQTGPIFIGHHKKADQWIPLGEHLEQGGTPREAVIRDCQEELTYVVSPSKIRLFNLSVVDIDNAQSWPCQQHYDLWYLFKVEIEEAFV